MSAVVPAGQRGIYMASFKVYIDESGDEGFCFDKGSPEWFVLSAVITRSICDIETVKLVDEARVALKKEARSNLHFQKLNHGQKVAYVDRIAKARLRAVSIMVHKPSLTNVEWFRGKNNLYNYAGRYLLERVSWLCRDYTNKKDADDGSAHVTFSNRSGMSYAQFKTYLEHLRKVGDDGIGRVNIEWKVIKPDQIEAIQHHKRMGLQIVDAVASSFFAGAQKNIHGFTEGRYATMLAPVVYGYKSRNGACCKYGYGVKIFPREAEILLHQEPSLSWLRETYKK